MKLYRARARAKQNADEHDDLTKVPAGFEIVGTSTYRDKRWVKTKALAAEKKDRIDKFLESLDRVQERAEKIKAIPRPRYKTQDLLAFMPWGDPHIGMYAWAEECGQNFDVQTACADIASAVDQLLEDSSSYRARYCVLGNMGDFYHADNTRNTTTLGTVVDVDTRQAKVIDCGIEIMFYAIDRCLEVFEFVDVWTLIGNHDGYSALWLARVLHARYRNNKRVLIDKSPARATFKRFGKCLIGGTHGDTLKWKDLHGVMSCDRAKDWGETLYRHWYTGHVHHDSVKELSGMTVETVRTLAPKDAWHAGQGYRSGQDMKLDIWHRDYGRRARFIAPIELIRNNQQE